MHSMTIPESSAGSAHAPVAALPQFVPPAVVAFLTMLADIPGHLDMHNMAYAASVILPKTRWPAKEFLQHFLRQLSHPPCLAVLEREHAQQAAGKHTPFSITLADIDGKHIPFLILPRPTRLPLGKNVITAAITTPTSSQPHLPDIWSEQERLLNLLDVLPAYVLLIDAQHNVQFDNRIARQLFGSGRDKKCYSLLYGRDMPCESCPPFSVLSSKAICISEWFSARTNNAFRVHSIPLESRQGGTMVLTTGINITANLRAQHALDISEQRYQSIADNMTIGVALLDLQLAAVTVNPRIVEWFGNDAVRGSSVCDILQQRCADADKGCGGCIFRNTLEDKMNHEREFTLLTHSGEKRQFRLVVCPILTRRKEVRGLIMMLEDVTERYQIQQHLQHLQKLEAMGALAGGIAHEINQPLSALHLYVTGLQMLLEQDGNVAVPRIMKRLALVLEQAARIREIINHMRALVMQEDAAPQAAASLSKAVAGALALVGEQLRAHAVEVILSVPATLPEVWANQMQLEQVLINLLVNAMHALDSVDRHDKIIHIYAETSAPDQARLIVEDNGPGIQGIETVIFDPFFTTKGAHQGMGLGLSIVHAFMSVWGGDVRAHNNQDRPGAAFTLTFKTMPAADSATPAAVTE